MEHAARSATTRVAGWADSGTRDGAGGGEWRKVKRGGVWVKGVDVCRYSYSRSSMGVGDWSSGWGLKRFWFQEGESPIRKRNKYVRNCIFVSQAGEKCVCVCVYVCVSGAHVCLRVCV